jgi:hypothetical protein
MRHAERARVRRAPTFAHPSPKNGQAMCSITPSVNASMYAASRNPAVASAAVPPAVLL